MWPIDLPPPPIVTTYAPNVPAGTWPLAARPVAFVLALPRSRDVGGAAAAELEVALRTWSSAPCTEWLARFEGERTAVAADDGVNVVLFHDDDWPASLIPGAIAQTVIATDAAGRYRDADIHLNGRDFRFSLDGRPGTQDLRSILVHELGHALGLGHTGVARATMFATGSGLRWRSLEQDDIDGVCALYPGRAAAHGGCDTIPCPAPFVCVANACQRLRDPQDVCSPCDRVEGACEAAGDDARCIDLVEGGRVCGRACAADSACGSGFHCRATTGAGDRQCVSDVGCRNGANLCKSDAECTAGTCQKGVCAGAGDPGDAGDPGADAANADASIRGVLLAPGGGACTCGVPRRTHAPWALAWLALLLVRRRAGPRPEGGFRG